MKRVQIEIDPKDDGTIEVTVCTLREISKNGSGGSYKLTKIISPVPVTREEPDGDV